MNMISAIVLTHNDERTIDLCMRSLLWVDEIIVMDDASSDRTLEIISSYTKKTSIHVVHRSVDGDFSSQRNGALMYAKGDWVLYLDADESVSEDLQRDIRRALISSAEDVSAFLFKRRDFFLGRWLSHGEIGKIRLVRMAKRGAGMWKGKVHEVWHIDGKTKLLSTPLDHVPHPTVSEFFREIDRYTTIASLHRRDVSLFSLLCFPIGKFFQSYIWYRGYRDGIPGLIVCVMMSIHSFLVRVKIWQRKYV